MVQSKKKMKRIDGLNAWIKILPLWPSRRRDWWMNRKGSLRIYRIPRQFKSNLQKERLINDVRYQEWTEMTLDCVKNVSSLRERNSSQGSFLFCMGNPRSRRFEGLFVFYFTTQKISSQVSAKFCITSRKYFFMLDQSPFVSFDRRGPLPGQLWDFRITLRRSTAARRSRKSSSWLP